MVERIDGELLAVTIPCIRGVPEATAFASTFGALYRVSSPQYPRTRDTDVTKINARAMVCIV